jgi:hypothetical protein
MARITIRRESGGGMLGLPVEIDGEKIGRVRPNKEISHEVGPGRHEVTVKRVPARVKAEVDVADGDEIRLVCSEASGFDRKGKPSVVKVGRALFTSEGGLTLEFDGTPPQD